MAPLICWSLSSSMFRYLLVDSICGPLRPRLWLALDRRRARQRCVPATPRGRAGRGRNRARPRRKRLVLGATLRASAPLPGSAVSTAWHAIRALCENRRRLAGPSAAFVAAINKCLAKNNKSHEGGKATKKQETATTTNIPMHSCPRFRSTVRRPDIT
jgi:hypothetical protein